MAKAGFGILGLVAGIAVASLFLRMGFSLGRSRPAPIAMGWVMPLLMVGLLALLLLVPQFGRDAEGALTGPIFFSTSGPGSQHAHRLPGPAKPVLHGGRSARSHPSA